MTNTKKTPSSTPTPNDENRRRFYFMLIVALAIVNGLFILNYSLNRPDLSENERIGFDLANQAVTYYDQGDYTQSLNFYTQAMQYLPDDAGLYYNRALSYLALSDEASAFTDLENAIVADEGYAPPFLMLGDLYDRTNRPDEALDAYRAYINLVGNNGIDAPRILIRIAEIEQDLN